MVLRSRQLLLLASTFALLFGLLEGVEIVILRPVAWIEPMRKASLDVLWVAPVVHLAVGACVAAVLWLAIRLRIPVTAQVACAVFAFAGMMGVTRYTGMIGLVGCIIVSAGVAVQAGRLGRRLPSTARLGSALLALAAIVVVAFVGGQALGGSAGRAAAGVASPSSAAPNILVVVLDTVRADRLSIHGYPAQTPTLDRLASEGTMFEWAISTSSWTLPAHASLLTGLAPEGHKGTTVDSVLSPAFDRLSQRFEGVGYRTGAFIANNIFVIPEHGFAPGFQVFDAHYVRSLAARTTWGRAAKAVGRRYLNRELDPFRPAETINAAFAAWRAQAPDRPFFALLNWMDAHDPYHPGTRLPDVRRWSRRDAWTDADRAALSDDYDAAIAHMDQELGRLRTRGMSEGWWDNTLLVVLADHGEGMADGSFNHGHALTLEQIHVPLLFRMPGRVPAGLRVSRPVSLADVAATIMALTPTAGAAGLPGTSLSGLFTEPAAGAGTPPVFASLTDANNQPPLDLRAVVLDGYQFVYDVKTSTEYLYALSDTAGTENLAGRPELAAVLERARAALRATTSTD